MRGSITRRGKRSWRLKYDVERVAGARQIRYVTVKGTRKDAEAELARLVNAVHTGTHIDSADITVGEWLQQWFADQKLSPRSEETYTGIVTRLTAAIGRHKLQKLRPVDLKNMHLVKRDGAPVAAATARHARRVLKAALQAAVDIELVSRNVAAIGKPLAAKGDEVYILGPEEITVVLEALRDDDSYPIVALALATGMRRGELLALRWSDVDLTKAVVTVERSLEQTTKHGYRFKAPKTKHGRRSISIPPETVEMLRDHRRKQLELRMALGMGKHEPDALVFCGHDGAPLSGEGVTGRWRRTTMRIANFPKVVFHALRHTHASALIAAGVDIVTISRRLGHSSPIVTLSVYSHLFNKTDTTAADAIAKVLGANRVPNGGRGP